MRPRVPRRNGCPQGLVRLRSRNHSHAPVLWSAQATSSGWPNRRAKRLPSVSRPKASTPLSHCATLPGKMAMKNAAVPRPTGTRCLGSATRLAPIAQLRDAGQEDDRIVRQRQRLRHLGDELLAREGQVADAGEEQHRAQRHASDGPRGGQRRSRVEQGRAGHAAMLAPREANGLRPWRDRSPLQPVLGWLQQELLEGNAGAADEQRARGRVRAGRTARTLRPPRRWPDARPRLTPPVGRDTRGRPAPRQGSGLTAPSSAQFINRTSQVTLERVGRQFTQYIE